MPTRAFIVDCLSHGQSPTLSLCSEVIKCQQLMAFNILLAVLIQHLRLLKEEILLYFSI